MYSRIVVPLDGSDVAEQALDEAKDMSSLTGAPLHLLRVVDPLAYQHASLTGMFIEGEMVAQALADEEEQARHYLAKISSGLERGAPAVAADVVRGPTVTAIVRFCQPGDLLVMASHGRGGLMRFFMGSVAEGVLRQATVPVLLIRARNADESS
jgi:nucleotide-binding universal stress UspA family protein